MNDDPERVNTPAAGMLEVQALKAENRKLWNRLMQFVWLNLDMSDEIDRLKAENNRLRDLVKLHMLADLARADLDRD